MKCTLLSHWIFKAVEESEHEVNEMLWATRQLWSTKCIKQCKEGVQRQLPLSFKMFTYWLRTKSVDLAYVDRRKINNIHMWANRRDSGGNHCFPYQWSLMISSFTCGLYASPCARTSKLNVYHQSQMRKPTGSGVEWTECSWIIGTGYWAEVFSLIFDSSIGLSAGIQSEDSVQETMGLNPAFSR